ncbi:condensation domain-containing protein [Streptomyces sp. NPDC032472]|uniref:condensation domain-containing protein n=1 Tax=Streptomyces sp. NPDC032472 TaxID=3155018 RepID=UPI0033F29988
MTTAASAVAVTVVIAPGPEPVLHLHGPLEQSALAALPPYPLTRHTPTHHTLHLPPDHPHPGTLADLLTGAAASASGGADAGGRSRAARAPRTATTATATAAGYGSDGGDTARQAEAAAPAASVGPVRPAGGACAVGSDRGVGPGRTGGAAEALPSLPVGARQREVLLDALAARPGAALHVEQLHWRWYGPLDTRRFHEAWQAVHDREPVLRAALAPGGDGPHVVVHPHAEPELVRHPYGSADWHSLLVGERLRPFDLHRPAPLRIALLDEQAGPAGPTRVILTYHHALLDGRSVRLLLRAFHRAYLAAGRARGGERRPDVRDHLRWLAGQDDTAPRAYWAGAAPPPGSRTLPVPPAVGAPAGDGPTHRGHGRTRHRLTPDEAVRLRRWAAELGAAESTALGAAWALLLHRATGSGSRPAPVAFAVGVSGRGIALEGAAGMPAPLQGPLPLHVRVDPAAPVAELLAELGERMLGASAYEWVSQGQIHAWSGRGAHEELTESVVSFDPPDGPAAALEEELAEEGVHLGRPQAVDAYTPVPLSVRAHHDCEGGLVLTAVNDRSRIGNAEAGSALAQAALLLRELPCSGDGSAPARDYLSLLPEAGSARPRPEAATVVVLRPATRPDAGTIVLLAPPDAAGAGVGAQADCHDGLAAAWRGPQALVTVRGAADAPTCLAALRPLLAVGEPLLLSCVSGGGELAYEMAHRLAAHGWPPPRIAVAPTPATLPLALHTATR